ncbi:nucleosome assembly protein [Panus rudis PR-1116 ss-1]|nr:nucleosome assembly protein [Panus rudis PR-1116 ss-1]
MTSLQRYDTDDDDYYESLPVDAKRAIQGIRGLQVAQVGVQKEFQKEVMALERKYAKALQTLYERRKEIVLGKIGASKEEIILGEVQSLKEDEDYKNLPALPASATTSKPTLVEGFWLRVLKGHPDIENMIQETDEPALHHLTDITISYPSILSGSGNTSLAFSVKFHFSRNEFFSNSTLTKTYVYKDEIGFFGDLLYSHVIGDVIQWKAGKDLIKLAEEAAGDDDDDDDEDDDDDDDEASFFTFFSPPASITRPVNDGEDSEDSLDDDFDIGEALKNQVIPRAVDYFTGDALAYELDSDDEFDFDFDDDDEDE